VKLQRDQRDWHSVVFSGATLAATVLIVAMLFVIVGNIVWHGGGQMSWRFIFGGTEEGCST